MKWKPGKRTFWIVVLILAGIQVIPVARTNPPVEEEVPAPSEVRAVLKRACYDCHSNESKWPWYSHVAPVSWLIARDVHEGREEMNFSAWNRLSPGKQKKRFRQSWDLVQKGEMPLWFYVPLHPEAKLSETDRLLLKKWALSMAVQSDAIQTIQ
ncbi:MAG TPA: heme-binding domain-containing protein [Fibrobacteria bacterium]|nr:heme-binding domain-containing protein [Fibrobacteria bacterium]